MSPLQEVVQHIPESSCHPPGFLRGELRESDRVRTPLPPQNQFIPEPSGPSSPTSVLLSIAGGSERAQRTLDGHILDIVFQQPKDVFHAPSNTSNGVSVLDEVQVLLAAGDHDPSESDIVYAP